jgi:hypothetical protein
MKVRTLHFAPARVTPGTKLAKAVNDRDGHALLAAGSVLDAEILDRLIRRGVESVAVLVQDTRDEETIATELRLAEERVAAIFRGSGNPARAVLQAAILNYRLESLK